MPRASMTVTRARTSPLSSPRRRGPIRRSGRDVAMTSEQRRARWFWVPACVRGDDGRGLAHDRGRPDKACSRIQKFKEAHLTDFLPKRTHRVENSRCIKDMERFCPRPRATKRATDRETDGPQLFDKTKPKAPEIPMLTAAPTTHLRPVPGAALGLSDAVKLISARLPFAGWRRAYCMLRLTVGADSLDGRHA